MRAYLLKISNKYVLNTYHVGEKLTAELSQSKIKIMILATFEEIKDKIENCGKELETNEKKKEPHGNSRSGK